MLDVLINRYKICASSEDGSAIIESYFEVPDALRPRVPLGARSDRPTGDWSFHSQNSLVSHIRALSDSTVTGASISRTGSSMSNPALPPGIGGANLPFALYPGDNSSRNALGLQGIPRQMTPEMAEASFTPSTAGWKSPRMHQLSSNTRI